MRQPNRGIWLLQNWDNPFLYCKKMTKKDSHTAVFFLDCCKALSSFILLQKYEPVFLKHLVPQLWSYRTEPEQQEQVEQQ